MAYVLGLGLGFEKVHLATAQMWWWLGEQHCRLCSIFFALQWPLLNHPPSMDCFVDQPIWYMSGWIFSGIGYFCCIHQGDQQLSTSDRPAAWVVSWASRYPQPWQYPIIYQDISSICKNKIKAIYGAGQPALAFDGARGCSIALHTHCFILILKEAKSKWRRRRAITVSCSNNYTIDKGGFCGGLWAASPVAWFLKPEGCLESPWYGMPISWYPFWRAQNCCLMKNKTTLID